MHPPTTAAGKTLTPAALQRAIMCALLSSPQACWTVAEIERELSASPVEVADALSALGGAGLVNRDHSILFASRAARAIDALGI